MAATMARYRIRVDLFLNYFIVPLLTRRRAASQSEPTEPLNQDETIRAVACVAETETRDEFRLHATIAALRFLLEEFNAGRRRKFSGDLMTYFLSKFLKIVLFGHSNVVAQVSDGVIYARFRQKAHDVQR